MWRHVHMQGDKAGARRLKLRVEDPPNRKHMVFLGGAVLADIMKVRPCVCARA